VECLGNTVLATAAPLAVSHMSLGAPLCWPHSGFPAAGFGGAGVSLEGQLGDRSDGLQVWAEELEGLGEEAFTLEALLEEDAAQPGAAWSSPRLHDTVAVPTEQTLRCLDESHHTGCTLCTPPPATEESVEFVSGTFKVLRGQLLASPEWDSSAAREAAAAAEEARGDELGLADVLRRKRGRELHKAQLLALCRTWGYKSDIWKPKTGRARKRALDAAAARAPERPRAPVQETLPPPRNALMLAHDSFSVAGCFSAELSPQLELSSAAFAGPRSRARTMSTSEAGFNSFSLREYAAMESIVRSLHRVCRQASVAQAGVQHLPQVKARASEPAALTLPLCGPDARKVNAVLDQMHAYLSSALRLIHLQKQAASASGTPMNPALAASHADYSEAVESGLAAFARAHAFISWQHATAPLASYLTAATLLCEVMTNYADSIARSFAARAAWSIMALERGAKPLDVQYVPQVVVPEALIDVPGHGQLPSTTAAIMMAAANVESITAAPSF
jgi:hypothetical protein